MRGTEISLYSTLSIPVQDLGVEPGSARLEILDSISWLSSNFTSTSHDLCFCTSKTNFTLWKSRWASTLAERRAEVIVTRISAEWSVGGRKQRRRPDDETLRLLKGSIQRHKQPLVSSPNQPTVTNHPLTSGLDRVAWSGSLQLILSLTHRILHNWDSH